MFTRFKAFLRYAINRLLSCSGLNLYNVTLSDAYRFVWFRVPKAGTNTIFNILENHAAHTIRPSKTIFRSRRYKDYFKFAFVRNPWDRAVSCYLDKVKRKRMDFYRKCYDKDFEYFINFIKRKDLRFCDRHIKLQCLIFPMKGVDFIGRFENFEEDLKFVLNKLGINISEVPRLNAGKKGENYISYYNDETKRIIEEKYKKDIELFGYKFGE